MGDIKMEKTKVLRLLVSVVLVLALTMSLMACQQKEPDPTPTPSETVKPSETTKPTETTKPSETTQPSETTEPTETPEPTETTTPGGLLNDEFWNWYSQGGNHIDYSELSTLTGNGSYVVDAINESFDIAITNTEFTGTVTFGDINVAGSLTLNMPNATIVFDRPASVGALNVTSGSHTFVLNAQLTITTSSGILTINGGNVELNAPVVTNDETPTNATIKVNSQGTITTSIGVTLDVNSSTLTIVVNTDEDISIKALNNFTVDTRNRSTTANNISVEFTTNAWNQVTEVSNVGESTKVTVSGTQSTNPIIREEVAVVTTETEFKTAITNKNAVITLGANIALTSPAHFDYTATLDLNGYTLSLAETYTTDDYLLAVKRGGRLLIQDSSEAKTGMINGGGKVCVKLTISGEGEGTSSTTADLTVESGTIYTTDMYAICGNGTRHHTTLTITGGTIKSEKKNGSYNYAAIYIPQDGIVTIKGGTIEGYAAALEARAGIVTIMGGTFKATAVPLTVEGNGSGTTTTGAALAIAQHSTKKMISVAINDGSFEGYIPVSITNPEYSKNGKTDNVGVMINGGTFTSTNTTATACDIYVDADAVSAYNVQKRPEVNPTLPANYRWSTDNKVESIYETISSGVLKNKVTGVYEISSKDGLVWFEQQVNKNKNSFNFITVKLTADIDMEGAAWTPVGQNDNSYGPYGAANNTVEYNGIFDGNGKTIKNFTITSVDPTSYIDNGNAVYSVGFFGYISGATIKDATFENVTVTGHHYMGVVAGYLETSSVISNVVVKNCTVNGSHKDNDYCGDKIGGIVGFVNNDCKIKNCQISNTTITAGRDAGQVAGYASLTDCVTGCTATNVTVSADTTTSCTGANINNTLIGRLG